MRRALVLASLVALGLAVAANGEMYRWTDAQGKVHFTTDLNQVPASQRPAARQRTRSAPPPSRLQTYSSGHVARPRRTLARRTGTLRIPFEKHGTLMMVKVRLNDSVVAPFLVDTGASHVSMPAFLASRLGLDIGPSTPHRTVVTANGQISVPVVRLDSVQVGDARIEHLEAHVNPTMQVGLLGGTFFNNFIYQVDAAESVINLSPNERVRGGLTENQWRSRFREIARPLAELDAHLSTGEFFDRNRQRQLEQRRAALAAELGSLEREANKLQVPHAWRQ